MVVVAILDRRAVSVAISVAIAISYIGSFSYVGSTTGCISESCSRTGSGGDSNFWDRWLEYYTVSASFPLDLLSVCAHVTHVRRSIWLTL